MGPPGLGPSSTDDIPNTHGSPYFKPHLSRGKRVCNGPSWGPYGKPEPQASTPLTPSLRLVSAWRWPNSFMSYQKCRATLTVDMRSHGDDIIGPTRTLKTQMTQIGSMSIRLTRSVTVPHMLNPMNPTVSPNIPRAKECTRTRAHSLGLYHRCFC